MENDHSFGQDGQHFAPEVTTPQTRLIQEKVDKDSFFVPRCSACKNEMEFLEGDVIFGDKWYHRSCWNEVNEMVKLLT